MGTSKLQRLASEKLSFHFGGYTIRENIRPGWLQTKRGERLELDLFIEELEVAIEVNGIQHYEFNAFFHGDYKGFESQKRRDSSKENLCKNKGVTLFSVYDQESLEDAIKEIKGSLGNGVTVQEYIEMKHKYIEKRLASFDKKMRGVKNKLANEKNRKQRNLLKKSLRTMQKTRKKKAQLAIDDFLEIMKHI
jgi:nitrogen regulatory protein PII-like uncharacterized protein